MRNRTGRRCCNRALRQWNSRGRGRAFTLIEVLIVIAILLALGGLLLVNFMPAKDKADADLQQVQFDRIDAAITTFKLHMKRWPTEDEGLTVLLQKDAIGDESEAVGWSGPYLDRGLTKDQWKHEIVYRIPSETMGEGYYDLISWGPDGQEGSGDDITNHDRLKNAQGEIEGPDGAAADTSAPPPVTGG